MTTGQKTDSDPTQRNPSDTSAALRKVVQKNHTQTPNETMSAEAPSADALAAQAGKLKSGGSAPESKAPTDLDPQALAAMKKLFEECGGDVAKLSEKTGSKVTADKAGDADSFAKNMLMGAFE